MQHHNYSLYDLEHMIPYEREIYVSLLAEHLQQEKERQTTNNENTPKKCRMPPGTSNNVLLPHLSHVK